MAFKTTEEYYVENPIAAADFDGTELMYLVKSSADGAALVSALVAYIKTQLGTAAQKSALEFAPAWHRHSDAGGGSGHVIEDEGTPVTQRANMNFTGAGVSVADSGGKTVVTIDGAAGGGDDFLTVQAFS